VGNVTFCHMMLQSSWALLSLMEHRSTTEESIWVQDRLGFSREHALTDAYRVQSHPMKIGVYVVGLVVTFE